MRVDELRELLKDQPDDRMVCMYNTRTDGEWDVVFVDGGTVQAIDAEELGEIDVLVLENW